MTIPWLADDDFAMPRELDVLRLWTCDQAGFLVPARAFGRCWMKVEQENCWASGLGRSRFVWGCRYWDFLEVWP